MLSGKALSGSLRADWARRRRCKNVLYSREQQTACNRHGSHHRLAGDDRIAGRGR
jgi:hypothetical protein